MAEVDSIAWGETYELTATALDADGVAIPIDGTWSAACRVTKAKVAGEVIANPVVTIASNAATTTIDTREAGWEPGEYWWDMRLTDPDGDDYWTEAVKLILRTRNAPASQ